MVSQIAARSFVIAESRRGNGDSGLWGERGAEEPGAGRESGAHGRDITWNCLISRRYQHFRWARRRLRRCPGGRFAVRGREEGDQGDDRADERRGPGKAGSGHGPV